MNSHILREVIHALRVEYRGHLDRHNDHCAEVIYRVIEILLWRLPEVAQCKGKNLKCTVTGMYYDARKVRSKHCLEKLLNRIYRVSTYSYFAVRKAMQNAMWEGVQTA
jgi:hypothetical protein